MDTSHDTTALRAWLAAMPKAELHLHLDGSLRPTTALELALERGITLPGVTDVATMRDRLTAPPRCRDQAELLRAYDMPLALLQDVEALERVTFELVEDVASDGTHYVEIRWAPSLHTEAGLSMRDGIDAVVRGARAGSSSTGITVRLIVVALRTHAPEIGTETAELAVATPRADISGFDLAGREHERPDPQDFATAFDVAREGGLGITCHAGEWGGAAQVRRALTIGPSRIAHGAPAADDDQLIADLRQAGVTLDICPTSNIQANIGDWSHDAPLPRLIAADALVTLSTDSRTASGLTLIREMERAIGRLGISTDDVLDLVRRAHAVAFLHDDEPLRARLTERFEGWASADPVPASAS